MVTLFPDMVPGFLDQALAGKARAAGRYALEAVDIRPFSRHKHGSVDDAPFGGGAGMVMRPDVVEAAVLGAKLKAEQALGPERAAQVPAIYLSPRGKRLDQATVRRLAALPGLILLCGRYEGVDARAVDALGMEEVSLGDFVLSGGEPAALVLLDAVIRLLPDVMGKAESHWQDSFENGLLEHPHFTRPAAWTDASGATRPVPDVLLSGNHAAIAGWRQEMAEQATATRRPDLYTAWRRQQEAAASGDAQQHDDDTGRASWPEP